MAGVRYLNAWSPDDPLEAAAYDSLLADLEARSVRVAQLDLPETLLDLRPDA